MPESGKGPPRSPRWPLSEALRSHRDLLQAPALSSTGLWGCCLGWLCLALSPTRLPHSAAGDKAESLAGGSGGTVVQQHHLQPDPGSLLCVAGEVGGRRRPPGFTGRD